MVSIPDDHREAPHDQTSARPRRARRHRRPHRDPGPHPPDGAARGGASSSSTSAFMATHAVYAVARLGIADVLACRAAVRRDVAADLGTGPRRDLPAPARLRGVRHRPPRRRPLRPDAPSVARSSSDRPDSMRSVVLMIGDPRYQAVWGQLPEAVTHGRPARRGGARRLDVGPARPRPRLRATLQRRDGPADAARLADGRGGLRLHAVRHDRRRRRRARTAARADARRGAGRRRRAAGAAEPDRPAEKHLGEAGVLRPLPTRRRARSSRPRPTTATSTSCDASSTTSTTTQAVELLTNLRRHMPPGAPRSC